MYFENFMSTVITYIGIYFENFKYEYSNYFHCYVF